MHYSTYFILNRAHFSECFDESAFAAPAKKMRIKFMIALVAFGSIVVTLSEQPKTVGFFFIALAFVEFFSFKYRKAWWLTRQMWSKNADNKITLSIDDNAITIKSIYDEKVLPWKEVLQIIDTPKGFLLILANKSQSYLSKSTLNEQVITFINSQKTARDDN